MTNALILTKVAKCLYRNGHGTYFALLKVRGKQIKRSLKTGDAAIAEVRSVPRARGRDWTAYPSGKALALLSAP